MAQFLERCSILVILYKLMNLNWIVINNEMFMVMRLILMLFTLVLLQSGCSVMGKTARVVFETNNQIYAVQPEAVRSGYPQWMKRYYFLSNTLVSDIENWRIVISSPIEIPNDVLYGLTVNLTYSYDGAIREKSVNLVPVAETHNDTKSRFDKTAKGFVYDFSLGGEAVMFWQDFTNVIFVEFKRKSNTFRYVLQPTFRENVNTSDMELYYYFGNNMGYMSIGELLRNLFMTDERWDKFCQGDDFKYDKTSACGVVYFEENRLPAS